MDTITFTQTPDGLEKRVVSVSIITPDQAMGELSVLKESVKNFKAGETPPENQKILDSAITNYEECISKLEEHLGVNLKEEVIDLATDGHIS